MIKFSKEQLKTPELARPVYLVTAGQSKFDRAIPDKRTEELCVEALTEAAKMIDKTPAELKSYIHSCYYGHFADHFGDQLMGEAVIHDRSDDPGKYVYLVSDDRRTVWFQCFQQCDDPG